MQPLKKRKLLYIFPSTKGHMGINVKTHGQVEAFKDRYHVKFLSLSPATGLLGKLLNYLSFELQSIWFSLITPKLYVRYNPKVPLTKIGRAHV